MTARINVPVRPWALGGCPPGVESFLVFPETLDQRGMDRLTSAPGVTSETRPHQSDNMIGLTMIALIARPPLENHEHEE